MSRGSGRYAVYFAPDSNTALARFGAAWLGYDAATGVQSTQSAVATMSPERLHEITGEPRRYGFHATLKPPYALDGRSDVSDLEKAVAALARRVAAFAAPPLRLARVGGFWALTLSESCPTMDHLAAICVEELDHFRAPPSETELARRRRAGLSPRQEALLQRWGYPYVMEEFRFHMTLTARLQGEESDAVGSALAPLVERLTRAPLVIDAISLFYQENPQTAFRILHRYPLAG